MQLNFENSYENSEQFIWLDFELSNSVKVLMQMIADVEILIKRKEYELIRKYEEDTVIKEEDENEMTNHIIEKNKMIYLLLEKSFQYSLYSLIINHFENLLKEIYFQIRMTEKKINIPRVQDNKKEFGEKWKNKFLDYYSYDIFYDMANDWDLLSVLYKIRNKIAHTNGVTKIDFSHDLENFDIYTFQSQLHNTSSLRYTIVITTTFLREVIYRLNFFSKKLMESLYNSTYKKN